MASKGKPVRGWKQRSKVKRTPAKAKEHVKRLREKRATEGEEALEQFRQKRQRDAEDTALGDSHERSPAMERVAQRREARAREVLGQVGDLNAKMWIRPGVAPVDDEGRVREPQHSELIRNGWNYVVPSPGEPITYQREIPPATVLTLAPGPNNDAPTEHASARTQEWVAMVRAPVGQQVVCTFPTFYVMVDMVVSR